MEGEDPKARDRIDEWLAVRCQLGERAAFDELIPRWAEPLRRYVRRVSDNPDTTDELVQDIWLRVLQGIPRLRTSITFVVLLAMAVAWACYAMFVLSARRPLLANHRVVAGCMAVAFTAIFAVGALGLGLTTGMPAMFMAATLGAVMVLAAIAVLARTLRHRARLEARRHALELELGAAGR